MATTTMVATIIKRSANMENSILKSKRTKEVDVNKPKLTVKEFKRQWILVAISAVYVVFPVEASADSQ